MKSKFGNSTTYIQIKRLGCALKEHKNHVDICLNFHEKVTFSFTEGKLEYYPYIFIGEEIILGHVYMYCSRFL